MKTIFKIILFCICLTISGCLTTHEPIKVQPPITPVEVKQDHEKAKDIVESINKNVNTALENQKDIKTILNNGKDSEEPAKKMVSRIAPHNDNSISELEKGQTEIKMLKEQMTDLQNKHLKLTEDYNKVIKSNESLEKDLNQKEETIKTSKADYVILDEKYKESQKSNGTLIDENKTLKSQMEDLKNIINNSLGKLAYILIGFGCLCIVGGVVGFVFTPDKSISIKAGVCGFLLVAAGGIVPSLVKAASSAAVMFFWFLVVILALYVVYNVYIIMKNEHIKRDLLQTATLLGTKKDATIENSADTINLIQSKQTKEYVDQMTKVLGTSKLKSDKDVK